MVKRRYIVVIQLKAETRRRLKVAGTKEGKWMNIWSTEYFSGG